MEFLRKQLSLIIRLLISGLVLYFLVKKLDWAKLWAYAVHAQVSFLVVAILLLGVTMVLGTYRWKILLHVQHIDLNYAKLFPMNMIGQFFNAFLLGTTGGDVVKIYYVTQATPEKRSAAGLSVIYDRILGLLGIMVWGLVLTLINYPFLTYSPDTHRYVWIFLFICAGAVGSIFFALLLPWIRKSSGLWRLEQKLPFHKTLENLSDAFQRYAQSPIQNVVTLLLSVFIHGCIFISMYCCALSLGLTISFWQLAAIVSIINVLVAVPINFAGLGVRELLFVYFLALVQIPKEQACAFSLLGFSLTVFWSLVGGVYYMRYKKHPVPEPKTVSA